uniref:Uncharacterized protein n=1 Tax=Oryza brachyantha TaxID=4533 RepID=J3KZ29_ORYBR
NPQPQQLKASIFFLLLSFFFSVTPNPSPTELITPPLLPLRCHLHSTPAPSNQSRKVQAFSSSCFWISPRYASVH